MRFKKGRLVLAFVFVLSFQGLLVAEEPELGELEPEELEVVGPQTKEPQELKQKQPGEPLPTLDLDVKDVDIRDVARMLSRVSNLNIVVGDDVKARVTMRAIDVDWETALNMILKTHNLTGLREGKFLRIITYEKLRQEEQGTPLENKVVFLNFISATTVSRALDSLKSDRGRISTDDTTNSLVIRDTPDRIKKMLEVIEQLDIRTPQVMIEALMVDIKLTDQEALGIDWNITHKVVSDRYIRFNLDSSTAAGYGAIQYGKTLLRHANLTALLTLWAENKRAEILANPKVLTLDGHEASIELIDEIPYLSSSISADIGITTSASFREGGIKLFVTPKISADNSITLNINTEQSFQSSTISTTTSGDQPVIDTRKAQTTLLVNDGETIVIGGLRKKDTTETIDKIPFLGDLPLIGRLFKRNVEQVVNTELLIFVTTYIVTEAELTEADMRSLERFEEMRTEMEMRKRKEISEISGEEYKFPLRPPK